MEQDNILTADEFFSDNYWDSVEHSNKDYIEQMALHLDKGTPAPDASHIRLDEGEAE